MKYWLRVLLLSFLSLIWSVSAWAESHAASAPASTGAKTPVPIDWQLGPSEAELLDQAVLKLPKNYAFLEKTAAIKLLRKMGNPNTEDVIGLMSGPGGDWIVVIRFERSGYIKEEKSQDWKVSELLDVLNTNIEKTNAIRQKAKISELAIVGWVEKPQYDKAKHRLTWAVSSQDKKNKKSEDRSVNYNIHALGRYGFISFNLVGDLTDIEKNKVHVAALLAGFDFNDGKKYTDFNSAKDTSSSYVVTELITGHTSNNTMLIVWSVAGVLTLAGVAAGVFFILRKKAKRAKPSAIDSSLDEQKEPEAAKSELGKQT